MYRLTDFLGTHWLAVAFLLTAVILTFRAYRARNRPASAAFAFALACYALGGLLLTNRTLTWFGPEWSLAWLTLFVASAGFVTVAFVLLLSNRWSFVAGLTVAGLGLLGLGGLTEAYVSEGIAEIIGSLRGLEFVRPWWLLLLVLVPVVVLLARRSLGGLGPTRKWAAIGARALIVALLVAALAEPRIRRPSEDVTVLFVIDRSLSIPQDVDLTAPPSEQVDRRWERIRQFVDQSVRQRGPEHRNDQAGVILFGKRPKLALPPAAVDKLPIDERMAGPIDGNYTDIAAALKLALASFPEGTGKRIVLISDGNENLGAAEEQATLARQNGVEIDTIALAPGYRNEGEVLVQAVEAPRTTASGQRLPVRVLVRNSSPHRVVEGLLDLTRSGIVEGGTEQQESVAIDADNPQVIDAEAGKPARVRLLPGLNSFRFRDRPLQGGEASYSYRATFIPIRTMDEDGRYVVQGLPGDRVANNQATTAVVSRGQQRVLFIDDAPAGESPHQHLINTLLQRKIRVDHVPAGRIGGMPQADFALFLSNYDLIVLANVPAESFTNDQMEAIRTSVHDQGCGLIMVGGPDAYGPGGYQNTPVEAALPVDCEIKALKAAGKGGLILIMHASEMAQGNKWQIDIAKLAINRLNPQDMVGILQYGWGGGTGVNWHIPFQEIGDKKQGLLAKVDSLVPGDMPDFDPFLRTAVDELIKPEYGLAVKHTIIISDGDPQYGAAGRAAVAKMAANGVTCTTVGVATHSSAESGKLQSIARGTKDGRGNPGNYYEPKDPNQLPAIYIKESRRVSQSFIYDKPFQPSLRLRGGPTDGLTGNLPPLHGFVRTTLKDSPLVDMQIEGPRVFEQRFPVLASWQYGLGKAVAFTSDARTQPNGLRGWDQEWVESDIYQKYWEQVVSWTMRAAEKGKLTVLSDYRDGRVRVTVDARDEKDKPVSGLDLTGGITLPRPPGPGERIPTLNFKRKGPGLYEAEFPVEEAGSYFIYVQGMQGGKNGALYDAARTGVSVPYSPEFADLESNTPLMRRLAEATGGNFYTDDEQELIRLAQSKELFRPAPRTVRALLPFWYWLVFAAGVLLLFDVGVRRISIEWPEVQAAATTAWSALRAQKAEERDSAALGRLLQRKQEVGEAIDRSRAARRFDPTAVPPSEPAPPGAHESINASSQTPLPPPPLQRPSEPTPTDAEDALSRLRKARDRARHRTERKDNQPDDK
jgi:uncharacterized membrane protein